MLVTRAKFAEMAGVSSPAITSACRSALGDACTGKKIDVTHPEAVRYIRNARSQMTKPADKVGHAARRESELQAILDMAENGPPIPDHLISIMDWTVRDVVDKFGTTTAFVDWLKAKQAIVAIEEREIKIAAQRGKLVSRELVEKNVFDVVESSHVNLLRDGCKKMAALTVPKVKAGANETEIEKMLRDTISRHIKAIKSRAARALEPKEDED